VRDGRAVKRKSFGGAFVLSEYEKIRRGGKALLRLSASDGQAGGQKFPPLKPLPFCPPSSLGVGGGFAP